MYTTYILPYPRVACGTNCEIPSNLFIAVSSYRNITFYIDLYGECDEYESVIVMKYIVFVISYSNSLHCLLVPYLNLLMMVFSSFIIIVIFVYLQLIVLYSF